MQSDRLMLRGRLLTFTAEPFGAEDTAAYTYIEDGALLIENGMIAGRGEFSELIGDAAGAEIVDHRPHLLMAGFIDTHIHFPQVQVIASWGAQLLDWLNTYTFPEETRFSDDDHAAAMACRFFDLLTNHGTTTAVAYCSVHKGSAEAYFEEAEQRNMRVIGGKVLMDRNAPDRLRDTPQSGYDDTKELIAKWHGKRRASYAITPRFAITSTPEQMDMARALIHEHPDCFVQTHLSENKKEIAYTLELYPEARDYLDVYQRYGLLSDKMLLGHSIHLEPREVAVMAETGSRPVFCPTSNLFLGSGLFDEERMRKKGIVSAIATDIGAGTSYSMLQTLNEGYKILQLQDQKLHPLRAFHWMTRGNAVALGMEEKIGTLDAGTEADVVVLNSKATDAMALRMERASNLSEELFILQMLGDDRAVEEVYIAGQAQKSGRRPAAIPAFERVLELV